jgi:transposase
MNHLFIGMDVHKKTWAITIQKERLIVKRFTVEANAEQLITYVQKHFPRHKVECCYESCCCGYHIYHSLTAAGWNVLVVNPGDIPKGNKQSATKTDKVDCAHLAQELSAGRLKGIYVPTHKQEQFRSLFRRRNDLVKNLRRIKCHMLGFLHGTGSVFPTYSHAVNLVMSLRIKNLQLL